MQDFEKLEDNLEHQKSSENVELRERILMTRPQPKPLRNDKPSKQIHDEKPKEIYRLTINEDLSPIVLTNNQTTMNL